MAQLVEIFPRKTDDLGSSLEATWKKRMIPTNCTCNLWEGHINKHTPINKYIHIHTYMHTHTQASRQGGTLKDIVHNRKKLVKNRYPSIGKRLSNTASTGIPSQMV